MAETGIEDIIRGKSSGDGCGSIFASLGGFLVLFILIGLLASYCAPGDKSANIPVRQEESK